jgi:hypothetical protein
VRLSDEGGQPGEAIARLDQLITRADPPFWLTAART